ncbi:thiamine transporter 2-like [Coccinella septempunctata]|uniref:thiamine transporter 2-like n=1 Tax=Coccinella septempunctata TaxID=41139 RepID=UPI001D087D5B|nr:thiamine transporter 2-like [Coccinella septempunctata]
MEKWLKISLILSLFGFFKEIRPSEPYVYEYLSGNWTDMSGTEVSEDVFTVGTYINTPLVIVAFLITDLLRYKPLIVLCGVFGIIVWSMLIWTPTLFMMQLMEIFYAGFASCDIAYFTYMYAKVDKEHYPKVTSNTRMAYLLGRSLSGILGQVLSTSNIMDYKQLNFITLGAMVLATTTALFLPSVKNTIYFHQGNAHAEKSSPCEKSKEAFKLMGSFFQDSFSKGLVIKWSIVNAVSACGFGLVEVYSQTLWSEINKRDRVTLGNGIVISIYTMIGVIGSFFAGYFKIDWSKRSLLLFASYFSIAAGFVILMSQAEHVYLSYALYSAFGGLYQFLTTVAYSEICQRIPPDSYGLILGINTFVGLVLQSLIVSIVIKIFHAPVRLQYLIFGCWHVFIVAMFIIHEIFSRIVRKRAERKGQS